MVSKFSRFSCFDDRVRTRSKGVSPVALCTVFLYANANAWEKNRTLGDVPSKSVADQRGCTVESLNLAIRLRMISCCEQLRNTRDSANILEELGGELPAVIGK